MDPGAIEEIAPGVHVIPDGRIPFIPNVGVVEGDRAVLVIDTAMGHRNGEAILALAKEVAGERKVILTTTHFHPEHAFGAKPFERDITYVMNAAQAEELGAKGTEYVEMFSTFGPGLAELLDGVELVPADLTYEGKLRIDLGGKVVELHEVGPAHTRGDQLIHVVDDGVLFAGDLVENAFFPILPDPDAQGEKWLVVLDTMSGLGPKIVVGGHGAVGGTELIDAFRTYFEAVRERTAELEAEGAEPDAIVATIEGEMFSRHEDWGNQEWVRTAVESFAKGSPA